MGRRGGDTGAQRGAARSGGPVGRPGREPRSGAPVGNPGREPRSGGYARSGWVQPGPGAERGRGGPPRGMARQRRWTVRSTSGPFRRPDGVARVLPSGRAGGRSRARGRCPPHAAGTSLRKRRVGTEFHNSRPAPARVFSRWPSCRWWCQARMAVPVPGESVCVAGLGRHRQSGFRAPDRIRTALESKGLGSSGLAREDFCSGHRGVLLLSQGACAMSQRCRPRRRPPGGSIGAGLRGGRPEPFARWRRTPRIRPSGASRSGRYGGCRGRGDRDALALGRRR